MPEVNVSRDALVQVRSALNEYNIDTSSLSEKAGRCMNNILENAVEEMKRINQEIEEKIEKLIIAGFSLAFGIRNRSFLSAIYGMFIAAVIWLWTKFCLMFLMWSSRQNEYNADKYVCELGYGLELAKGLDAIGGGEPQKSFLKALYSTHPNTHDRIGRLQQMGVPYYRY